MERNLRIPSSVLLLAALLVPQSLSEFFRASAARQSIATRSSASFVLPMLRGGASEEPTSFNHRKSRTLCMSSIPKEFWVLPSSSAVLTAAVESSFTTFLLPSDLAGTTSAKIKRFTLDGDICIGDSGRRLPIVRIFDAESAKAALMKVRRGAGEVLVNASVWGVINSENLVAAAQEGGTKVMMLCDSAAQAKTLLGSLERGVDGVVLRAGDVAAVQALADLKASIERQAMVNLSAARVTGVSVLGMGDRVCVDLVSALRLGEGLLVGSSSKVLSLVHGETVANDYCTQRPFRINAGALMSYVLLPHGKTAYLSELRAGDEVLVVDAEGRSRSVHVGRVKLERRPMVMVQLESETGLRGVVILQNVETVRLVTAQGDRREGSGESVGQAVSIGELEEGVEVLVRTDGAGGRHLGLKVDEFLEEQ